MHSILIAGQGKTGTTGVYNAVKEALGTAQVPVNCLFEPTTPEPLLALGRYDPQTPILTKIMSHRLDDCRVRYHDFDRRVMTVRDPRDVVISRLLFFPLIRSAVKQGDTASVDEFVAALRAKEADPQSRSVLDLTRLAARLGIARSSWRGLASSLDVTSRQIRAHDFHVLRYEDFVDGDLGSLSEYVGLEVTNPAATGEAWLSHIPRSMAYGDWRNWFTGDDVDYFADLFAAYMTTHGYDPTEVPHAHPKIDPATASEYVERKLTDRRSQVESRYSGRWSPEQVETQDELTSLVQMAGDGDAVAGYRAALVLVEGDLTATDSPSALELARGAAKRGHVEAMRLTARLLRAAPEGVAATDAGEMEARFWDREADLGGVMVEPLSTTSRSDTAKRQDTEQVHRLRRRLKVATSQRDALASSTRYRVGALLAQVAAGPWQHRRRAMVRLLRLAVSRLRRR